jgi:hypothetical protein
LDRHGRRFARLHVNDEWLSKSRHVSITAVQLLVEGCSVRTVERITGIHRDAILQLLVIAGERCEAVLDSQIQNVPVKDVEADEVWSFIGMKEKNKRGENAYKDDLGDCYCWVAIERNTKLVLAYQVGNRTLAECVPANAQTSPRYF